MKIAVLHTMYDEHENVLENIHRISEKYKDAIFLVTHSFDKDSSHLNEIKNNSYYNELSNLGETLERIKIPANAISRNYSDLFKRLYEINTKVDIIVALTGDTKITNPIVFEKRYNEMKKNNYKLYVCQAKSQVFWSKNRILDRLQVDTTADFMPQLFFVDGDFAFRSKVFADISVVNDYTSEQCLGNEFLLHASLEDAGRLNKDPNNWLSYTDGVVWQSLTNGQPGRP